MKKSILTLLALMCSYNMYAMQAHEATTVTHTTTTTVPSPMPQTLTIEALRESANNINSSTKRLVTTLNFALTTLLEYTGGQNLEISDPNNNHNAEQLAEVISSSCTVLAQKHDLRSEIQALNAITRKLKSLKKISKSDGSKLFEVSKDSNRSIEKLKKLTKLLPMNSRLYSMAKWGAICLSTAFIGANLYAGTRTWFNGVGTARECALIAIKATTLFSTQILKACTRNTAFYARQLTKFVHKHFYNKPWLYNPCNSWSSTFSPNCLKKLK